jgi:large subunit ribosomal protein L7/L12
MINITRYELWMLHCGNNKIQVIKAVRELTAAGLRETKDFVESTPAMMFNNLSLDEATQAYEHLEAEGAQMEIRLMTEGYILIH